MRSTWNTARFLASAVLRRKGDVYYRKLVGKFNDSELMSFIDNGLKSEPTAEVAKR